MRHRGVRASEGRAVDMEIKKVVVREEERGTGRRPAILEKRPTR
ncbi:hypothetical protein SRB17_64530 [Streptomyces sp. RB17]|nr:hypothetical protein [Streptomyces sp. RB17]